MILSDSNKSNTAKVVDPGVLLVGLDGFTLEDLANRYPGVQIGIHVQDSDGSWVPVTMEQLKA